MAEAERAAKKLFPPCYDPSQRKVDPAAYYTALRENGVPDCLHTPTVAADRAAIEDFVGVIVATHGRDSAFLVRRFDPAPMDLRYPIVAQPNFNRIHQDLQVWVRTRYTRYRRAFQALQPNVAVDGLVLHHIVNRRYAAKCGFDYIRLVPVRRATNSSSAYSEDWGVNLDVKGVPGFFEKHRLRGYRIKYADLTDLLAIMDIEIGGGFMEVVRLAQDLIEIPGVRKSQASLL